MKNQSLLPHKSSNFIILLILLRHPIPSIPSHPSDPAKNTEFPNLKTTRGKSKGWSDPGGVRRAGRNSIAPPRLKIQLVPNNSPKGREVVRIPILKQKKAGFHSKWYLLGVLHFSLFMGYLLIFLYPLYPCPPILGVSFTSWDSWATRGTIISTPAKQ